MSYNKTHRAKQLMIFHSTFWKKTWLCPSARRLYLNVFLENYLKFRESGKHSSVWRLRNVSENVKWHLSFQLGKLFYFKGIWSFKTSHAFFKNPTNRKRRLATCSIIKVTLFLHFLEICGSVGNFFEYFTELNCFYAIKNAIASKRVK